MPPSKHRMNIPAGCPKPGFPIPPKDDRRLSSNRGMFLPAKKRSVMRSDDAAPPQPSCRLGGMHDTLGHHAVDPRSIRPCHAIQTVQPTMSFSMVFRVIAINSSFVS